MLHPSRAHAQDQPAVGDAVDGGRGVRQQERMPQCRKEDGRADRDAAGPGGHRGEEREGLEPRPRERRVARPHGVEAELLGARRELQQGPDLRPSGHRGLPRRQHHADLQREDPPT